jgi:hypothetical protein
MFRKTLRTLAVLALVTLTTTSAAHAAGRSFSGLEISDRLSEVWERIAGWFGSLTGQSALSKEGSSMDPNGGHTNPGTTNGTSSDAGSSMDPNG